MTGQNPLEQTIADAAAGVSVASASYAWLGTANEVVQIVAGIVASIAGIAAAWYHIDKTLDNRRRRKEAVITPTQEG